VASLPAMVELVQQRLRELATAPRAASA